MGDVSNSVNGADSISCLHTIEHFGLGRYGDQVDPRGHLEGFQNLLKILLPGGKLYISFPIGSENQVHFNAHRIFHPEDILSWPTGDAEIQLIAFDYVDDDGRLHRDAMSKGKVPLLDLRYGCGIYTFQRLS
jgi:hypothetical protein